MLELVLFRGIQGLFGGVLFASIFAELGDLFPPTERAKITPDHVVTLAEAEGLAAHAESVRVRRRR